MISERSMAFQRPKKLVHILKDMSATHVLMAVDQGSWSRVLQILPSPAPCRPRSTLVLISSFRRSGDVQVPGGTHGCAVPEIRLRRQGRSLSLPLPLPPSLPPSLARSLSLSLSLISPGCARAQVLGLPWMRKVAFPWHGTAVTPSQSCRCRSSKRCPRRKSRCQWRMQLASQNPELCLVAA